MIITTAPRLLTLQWPDGSSGEFDSLWLLDNAPRHRDSSNGQRLIDISKLPHDPLLAGASLDGESIVVQWQHGEAATRFPVSFLRNHASAQPTPQIPEIVPWSTMPRESDFLWSNYAAFVSDGKERYALLKRLRRDGIAFLRGVPSRENIVLDVAGLLGCLLETNYGRVFDVKVKADPENLADSDAGLGLHTDNPYREPVPGFQALHVLQPASAGGESLFADGFAIAATLRQTHPAEFHLLATVPVPFRYSASTAELSANRPFLSLAPNNEVSAVHYNNRSIAPLRLPAAEVRNFYSAYRLLADTLRAPHLQLRTALAEGDLVVFDNWRILHGRTGFDTLRQARHLQGCYLTRDSVQSSLALLQREFQ